MRTFEDLMGDARNLAVSARGMLDQQIKQVGMVPQPYAPSSNQQAYLLAALEDYIRKESRVQVLEAMGAEDFYIAMSRSAAAVGEP